MKTKLNKIRDELAYKFCTETAGFPKPGEWQEVPNPDRVADFKAGFDAAMERAEILEKALEYYANSSEYDESSYTAISSNFRSNFYAKSALKKFRGEE